MARHHRPSSPDMVPSGFATRDRSAGTGQPVEAPAVHEHLEATILGSNGPQVADQQAFGNERIMRSVVSGRMVEAVMNAAAGEGLTAAKDGRIAGRVSSELIAKAKARTGLSSDTELLEFALASIAIEDHFAEAFHAVRGTIDPEMDFGF